MDEMYRQYAFQSDLQRQANESNSAIYASQLSEQVRQNQAILVEQTNPNKVIKQIELALRNIEESDNGVLIRVGEPIVNDFGINRLKFIMRSIINQNTILSHLEDKQIAKLIIQLSNDIVDDLSLNWRAYGIKDKILLDYITDAIVYPSFFALQRAWGQNEKNWLGKISVENISNAQKLSPKKEGFLSKLKL